MVVAEILEQPSKRSQPVGRIVEVLGDHMAPGMEIDIAIRTYEIPCVWPDDAAREAEKIPPRVPRGAGRGRTDLRDKALVTIDGADARDFDDAVHCERTPSGWKLTVAIADVAAYVKPGSALDDEARTRGNSVYFPQRVVPMLPESLSNGLCSLRPDEDRLCMVCELLVGRDGEVRRTRFYEGLMRSRARLTYDEVAEAVVARRGNTRERLEHVARELDELYKLYRALRRSRERRGAIDLDTQESLIRFGPDGKIEGIESSTRNDAHRLIEECMIAANVAAARFLERHKMVTLYRIHDRPDSDKVAELREFLAELGLRLGGGARPEASHFGALIRRTSDRADSDLIQGVVLRSLAQASYSPRNVGHFGLALPSYAHFTSPIRRYPDLLVHRAIKHVLDGSASSEFRYDLDAMFALGDHASMTERRADEATRDAVSWLKCEYMMDKVGESFHGTIVGVTSFGLFVSLDDVQVEGLIHVSTLGADYFHFDPAHHRMSGERSGVVYRLADRVRVRVARVSLDDRRIDLELVGGKGRGGAGRGPKRTRGRRARQ
jgi:ribonuclease R